MLLSLAAATSTFASPTSWLPTDQAVLQPLDSDSVGGKRGAVASESKVCSQIGIDLLASGVSIPSQFLVASK